MTGPNSAQITLSLTAPPEAADEQRASLAACGFEFAEAPHAFWRARGEGCTVTFYRKGKVVLQGPTAPMVAALLGLEVPEREGDADDADGAAGGEPFAAALALHPQPPPAAWIGSDETGKGDWFGPLIVAAARLERRHVRLVAELGAADSKTLSDRRVLEIAPDLKKVVTFKLVIIGPEAYNRLYPRLGNLNRVLAWGHARAIEDVLRLAPATYALTDQFGDRSLVERALRAVSGEEQRVLLDQRPRAEADPAVAVASILARNELLWQLKTLSREAGFALPKGAGPPVLAAGRRLVSEKGRDALARFAKLHFATTDQVLTAAGA
jgi:ribonuclease HIII